MKIRNRFDEKWLTTSSRSAALCVSHGEQGDNKARRNGDSELFTWTHEFDIGDVYFTLRKVYCFWANQSLGIQGYQ